MVQRLTELPERKLTGVPKITLVNFILKVYNYTRAVKFMGEVQHGEYLSYRKIGMEQITYNDYLEYKELKLSRKDFAEMFGYSEDQLKRLIAKNKWALDKPKIANINVFDSYSEESCYWAGFLAADGNVDSKNRIRVMLKYDDILHLEKFKNFLGSTHKISSNTTTYNRCSFEFTNQHIREILERNFSIVPNKTSTLEFPISIPSVYIKDYIRGYFDGDGSICESFSNKNSITATIYTTFASGSKNFSYSLFNYLNNLLELGGHLQEFNDSNKWQLKYNTNDAKVLLDYMYKDSIVYLDRKFALYNRLVVENVREKR